MPVYPSPPWVLSHEIRLALYGCRPRAPRWSPPGRRRHGSVLVVPMRHTTRWARSAAPNRPSSLSHRPRWAMLAWQTGRPVAALTEFYCGTYTLWARGEHTPTGEPCRKCLLAAGEAHIVEGALDAGA